MGILNATPDSFYAASRVQAEKDIAARADQIIAEGAAIIDVGGCSTRPGSTLATEKEEVERLKHKANGGKRLVICYMSIGEAEDYRYYWQSEWKRDKPAWLARENPEWRGNYKVRYWDPAWQEIICGAGDSYLNRILAAGFDGVYLDIIDAFEYFE